MILSGSILLTFIAGCSGTRAITSNGNSTDNGYYKNHVNSGLIRSQIKEGFRSVLRIQNNVIYRTYRFYLDELPRESDLYSQNLDEISGQS